MRARTGFEHFEHELKAGVRRRRPRRLLGRGVALRTVLIAVGITSGAGAIAWGANALLSSGDPVPYVRGAPVPGIDRGVPVPGTLAVVARAADPAGGPQWGLRHWVTDRRYGCVQVGRLYQGKLGTITNGKVFHEIRPGVVASSLGGCFNLDGGGRMFAALHARVTTGGVDVPCYAHPKCGRAARTIDFGLLGPRAQELTFVADGRRHSVPVGAPLGAYLIVQGHVPTVRTEIGFHHQNPRLNRFTIDESNLSLTPESAVIKSVKYASGACTIRVRTTNRGSCIDLAGYVPVAPIARSAVRSPVRAFLAPGGAAIRVRFRARQEVVDARSVYVIEVHPARRHGWYTQDYAHNLPAGGLVRTTVGLYNHQRGKYRIVVRFKSASGIRPPIGWPVKPGQWPIVGTANVIVP